MVSSREAMAFFYFPKLAYTIFMPNAYDNPASAEEFNSFLESKNGQIQRNLLLERIVPYLRDRNAYILDAACGQGWLAAALRSHVQSPRLIKAFDSSTALITTAQKKYPCINFRILDITATLPYADDNFDYIILNMAAHDIHDLPAAFANLFRLLKPNGTFIMTVANPYYAYPVGVWKRGLIGRLFRKKPSLKVRSYHEFRRGPKNSTLHNWKSHLSSYFYPLADYLNTALRAGFILKSFEDLELPTDSPHFDSQYQLYRFPMIVLMVFEKGGK